MKSDRPSSKVCDAADFFSEEFIHTVRQELCETPRMHRKQWEFAMIYLALKQRGMLDNSKVGLSMGSGRERLLYAIARRAGHVTATDLYSSASTWECAQASDPGEYIRMNKPIPVDDAKLTALNMDMRKLSFGDGSFDFAYSSCALEHIGQDADFLQHLNEVHRVLKDGGIYVLTTEFTFEQNTIAIPNNYLFSADHIGRLIEQSAFTPEMQFDARITDQSANFPLPGQVEDLSHAGSGHFLVSLSEFGMLPHVQLLQGKHAFTSCILVLRKDRNPAKIRIVFNGLETSRVHMQACLWNYRSMIARELTLNPFSFLPGRTSAYYAPHAAAGHAGPGTPNTIFHTNYYWLGTGLRKIHIALDRERGHDEACSVEVRVHRSRTLDPAATDCCFHESVALTSARGGEAEIALVVEEEYAYAVLANMQTGTCLFSNINVRVSAPMQAAASAGTALLPGAIQAQAAGPASSRIKQIYHNLRRIVSS